MDRLIRNPSSQWQECAVLLNKDQSGPGPRPLHSISESIPWCSKTHYLRSGRYDEERILAEWIKDCEGALKIQKSISKSTSAFFLLFHPSDFRSDSHLCSSLDKEKKGLSLLKLWASYFSQLIDHSDLLSYCLGFHDSVGLLSRWDWFSRKIEWSILLTA